MASPVRGDGKTNSPSLYRVLDALNRRATLALFNAPVEHNGAQPRNDLVNGSLCSLGALLPLPGCFLAAPKLESGDAARAMKRTSGDQICYYPLRISLIEAKWSSFRRDLGETVPPLDRRIIRLSWTN